jgi:hypothetical protein
MPHMQLCISTPEKATENQVVPCCKESKSALKSCSIEDRCHTSYLNFEPNVRELAQQELVCGAPGSVWFIERITFFHDYAMVWDPKIEVVWLKTSRALHSTFIVHNCAKECSLCARCVLASSKP